MAPLNRPTLLVARQKAEKYCAYQERCHSEVAHKLRLMGLQTEEINDILLHLIQHNFLNEERFAIAYAGGKYRTKGWGRKKIVYNLKSKGINQHIINRALKEIPDEEYNTTIIKLIQKKDAQLKHEDRFKRMVAMQRFLAQKGFENELIVKEVNKYYEL